MRFVVSGVSHKRSLCVWLLSLSRVCRGLVSLLVSWPLLLKNGIPRCGCVISCLPTHPLMGIWVASFVAVMHKPTISIQGHSFHFSQVNAQDQHRWGLGRVQVQLDKKLPGWFPRRLCHLPSPKGMREFCFPCAVCRSVVSVFSILDFLGNVKHILSRF